MSGPQLSPETLAALAGSGLAVGVVTDRVRMALDEDLAYGPDVTTASTVPDDQAVVAAMAARRPGVVAGLPVALVTLDLVVGPGRWRLLDVADDGATVGPADVVLRAAAPTREMLTAERTMLNFVCHMSGVATLTARWAAAIAPVTVRDSRKTIPGFRELDKYAVRCGGGANHRMGLGDAALVKDNHVAAAGSVTAAVAAVRDADPSVPLEVECDTLEQVAEAIDAGVGLVMLDNMPVDLMRQAVDLAESRGRREGPHQVRFEASGGLSLESDETVEALVRSGVDFAAVGALTHSAPALDLGLDVEQVGSVTDLLGKVDR